MRTTLHRRTDERAAFRPLWAFAGLTATTAAVVGSTAAAGNRADWRDWLDAQALQQAVDGSAEVVAAVLAIAVTVVAIVVELAANRYSHLITRLFVREPANLLVLGLFVVTTLQCLWLGPWAGSAEPELLVAPLATMSLVTLSLLSLLPYVYYVFNFLSPISIIDKIYQNTCRTLERATRGRWAGAREGVRQGIDELQDVARSAIVRGDRDIAMAAVDALAELIFRQDERRDALPDGWFAIDGMLARDPDFVALAGETRAELESGRTWLEAKIFRRMVALVGQSCGQLRDVANLVAIHTQHVAVTAGVRRDELMTLCLRAFNSYLRTTINAHDMRTAYYLQNQYRLVAEHLLAIGEGESRSGANGVRHSRASLGRDRSYGGESGAQVDEIAGHLEHYGQLAHRAGMPFLLETAAHDIAQLVAAALALDHPVVDDLLTRLLNLDQEIREEAQEESLLGVRRAQIRMGTLLIDGGHDARARRIAADLALERPERLERLREGLLRDQRPQYWELIDRGMNFAYLAPELRPHLDTLFAWIGEARGERVDPPRATDIT